MNLEWVGVEEDGGGFKKMANLYIPSLGDRMVLAENWTFTLYFERRNRSLIEKLGMEYRPIYSWEKKQARKEVVVIPAGTMLSISRIYIRSGQKEFDSMTFRIVDCPPNKALEGSRFWAKLADCNLIKFNFIVH